MSAKAIGRFSPFVGTALPGGLDHLPRQERRTRVRTKVHWPVLFQYNHGETLETVTENLSSQGFYCHSQMPIACGEALLCWLTVPTHDPSHKNASLVLECRIRVVRSEAVTSAGLYGVACRIEDYRFTREEPILPV